MNIEQIRQNFKAYMQERFPNDNNISSTVSMAFFAVRHSEEFDINFQDILTSRTIPDSYRQRLEKHFANKARKDPRGNAGVYERSLRLLLEYLNGKPYIVSSNTVTKVKASRHVAEINIPLPTKQGVLEYLDKWEQLSDYTEQEQALNLLFLKTFPKNTDISEVLIKCSTLNDFYSTNIFKIHPVAKHIINLDIDLRLTRGDSQLVNEISIGHGIKNKNGRELNLFSFATKYCSHHNPIDYPIFDSYVEKILIYFRDKDKFSDFKTDDLRNFIVFKQAVIDFRNVYQLQEFNLKQIDQYLWQFGKEYFPKKY
jgi:hypothetical protein